MCFIDIVQEETVEKDASEMLHNHPDTATHVPHPVKSKKEPAAQNIEPHHTLPLPSTHVTPTNSKPKKEPSTSKEKPDKEGPHSTKGHRKRYWLFGVKIYQRLFQISFLDYEQFCKFLLCSYIS